MKILIFLFSKRLFKLGHKNMLFQINVINYLKKYKLFSICVSIEYCKQTVLFNDFT